MSSNFTISLFLLVAIACLSEGCCPERFMQVGNRCYYYNSGKVDWHDARAACLRLGAHLVSIHNLEDSREVYALWKSLVDESLRDNSDAAYWIGLNDERIEGSFKWSDGTHTDYTLWQAGEPNDSNGGEDCVAPRNQGRNDFDRQKWNDNQCGNRKSYFCRRSLYRS
ncbi:galactose-specific lectin nattectin-like [Strongylocentrotus purpuratus]|uniref:C-type lectin domain-containing protein n=1 Tax=Strongylocentrotus purpuratus TaxID=7668 RepID=A0A7M7PBL7_STRPU|nr:galactose-specific lectin nattectin [Strongylocentrotus purpuratus]XP_030848984.1 galactose-specific lectin nattectin-like [Strongylocentrotus purpuratus]|eukprot:XP_003729543.1 PREDICTED: galactose-specific lectin nattectin-like [Strongylocentrotus purpuratus]